MNVLDVSLLFLESVVDIFSNCCMCVFTIFILFFNKYEK